MRERSAAAGSAASAAAGEIEEEKSDVESSDGVVDGDRAHDDKHSRRRPQNSDHDDENDGDDEADEANEDENEDHLGDEDDNDLLLAATLSPSAAAAAALAASEAEVAADAAADRRTTAIGLGISLASLASYRAPLACLSAAAFALVSGALYLSTKRSGSWYRGGKRVAAAVGYRLCFAALAQFTVASGRGRGREVAPAAAAAASSSASSSSSWDASAASFWAARMAPFMIPFFTLSARLGESLPTLAGMLVAYLGVVAAMQPAACCGIEACWPRGREHFVAAANALNGIAAAATGTVAVTAKSGSRGSSPRKSSPSSHSLSATAAAGERACFDIMTFLFVSSAAASLVLERMYYYRSSIRRSGGSSGCGSAGGAAAAGSGGASLVPSTSSPPASASPATSPPSHPSSSPLSPLLRIESAATALGAVLLAMLLTWIALAVAGEAMAAATAEVGGSSSKPSLTEFLERHGQGPCAPAA